MAAVAVQGAVPSSVLILREGETMTGRAVEITGNATVMACPTCRGILYEVQGGNDTRFRCTNGHSHTPEEICPGFEDSLGALLGDAIGALSGIKPT